MTRDRVARLLRGAKKTYDATDVASNDRIKRPLRDWTAAPGKHHIGGLAGAARGDCTAASMSG